MRFASINPIFMSYFRFFDLILLLAIFANFAIFSIVVLWLIIYDSD